MATTESTTQPIICCLGANIAGCPTQFLLERAFESERLHWQALSVEIAEDKFLPVCDAMMAMGFLGIRFYGQLALSAAQQLSPTDSMQHFVGSATSAMAVSGRWQIWDHLGPAWLALIFHSQQPKTDRLWLHGDSLTTRSLFACLLKVAGPANWIWTDAPEDARSSFDSARPGEIDASRIILPGEALTQDQIINLLACSNSSLPPEKTDDSESPSLIRIALVTELTSWPESPSESMRELLESLEFDLIAPNHLQLPARWQCRQVQRVSSTDLRAAGELYDIQQWTGKSIDISLVRDALDEYSAF